MDNKIFVVFTLIFFITYANLTINAYGQQPATVDDSLQNQISILKERITNLESKDQFSVWIPIILSMITATVLIISFWMNKRSTDLNTKSVHERSAIDAMKIEIDFQNEIRKLTREAKLETGQEIVDNAEQVLNKLDQIAYYVQRAGISKEMGIRFKRYFEFGSAILHWQTDRGFDYYLTETYPELHNYLEDSDIDVVDGKHYLSSKHIDMLDGLKVHIHESPLCKITDKQIPNTHNSCMKIIQDYNCDDPKKCEEIMIGPHKGKCRCVHPKEKNYLNFPNDN